MAVWVHFESVFAVAFESVFAVEKGCVFVCQEHRFDDDRGAVSPKTIIFRQAEIFNFLTLSKPTFDFLNFDTLIQTF